MSQAVRSDLCANAERLRHTLFDRAQSASIHRLYRAPRSGQIKNFIFPYLGQLDKALPNPPADLVRREEAQAYPANFSAMSPDWIDRLSLRGGQLTLCPTSLRPTHEDGHQRNMPCHTNLVLCGPVARSDTPFWSDFLLAWRPTVWTRSRASCPDRIRHSSVRRDGLKVGGRLFRSDGVNASLAFACACFAGS